jgi:hypothetical protein
MIKKVVDSFYLQFLQESDGTGPDQGEGGDG